MRRIFGAVGKWLLLGLCLALAALPAVYSASVFGYLPALLLCAALLVSLLWLLLVRRGLRVEMAAEDAACPRGGSLSVGVRVLNGSALLCPRAEARIRLSAMNSEYEAGRSFRFALGGGKDAELRLELEMPHIGCYSVELAELRVYGFFGLASLRVRCEGKLDALVTPRLSALAEMDFSGAETRDANRDTRVMVVGGTDYTGVREYEQGDPMKQIHWKLSAHTRDYVTKLQESSRQQEFGIILDFLAEKQPEWERLLDIGDCLIETALSLGAAVTRREGEYTLLYTDAAASLRRSIPADADSVPALLRSFAYARAEAGVDFPDAAAILRQEGSSASRAANVLVVTSRVTEELLQELQTVKRQRRNPQLFFVFPAAWTSRERETQALRLRTLDEAEIPYTFVSTAESFQT